jgi:hypothetical protein
MVVGFETLQDATSENASNTARRNVVEAALPLRDATGGLAPAGNVALNASQSKKATESHKMQFEGERIYTIGFKPIKFSYLKRRDVDPASIGKSVWKRVTATRSQNDSEDELVRCELMEWDEVGGAKYEKVSHAEEDREQTNHYALKEDAT